MLRKKVGNVHCWFVVIAFLGTYGVFGQSKSGSATLTQRLNELAQPAQGRVGMAAMLLETGELVGLREREQFPMQSVYKLPIGMAVLHQVDQKKLNLSQIIHVLPNEYISARQHSPLRDKFPNGTDVSLSELLRLAISESDGSASDVLMRVAGGPQAVMRYLKTLGVTGIVVANTEMELGRTLAVQYRNWATPVQMIRLLRVVADGKNFSPTSHRLLLHLMTDTETGLKRLKGALPEGTLVAHKTGTSMTIDGLTAATNDVGLITLPSGKHLAIAVFVADARADQSTREAVIANLARIVYEQWK